MEYIGDAGSSTVAPRLMEFNFSATTRFCVEFAPGVLRFWSNGLLVTTLSTVTHPYTAAETFEIQAKQVNDVVYLAHPSRPPMKLTRKADNNWTLEVIDWKYPPLRDENVEPDRNINPVVNQVWESQLSMAEEFEIPVLNEVPVPWVEMSRSGATDTAWFALDGRGGTGSVYPVTIEVLDGSDWVAVGTIAGFDDAATMQFCFQPHSTVTTLRTRYRIFSGSWGAWDNFGSLITTFLPAASTAANMPNITVRCRSVFYSTTITVGDESLGFDPLTTYAVGPITELPTESTYHKIPIGYWSTGTVSPVVTAAYTKPAEPPTLPNKAVSLQIWNGTAWATVEAFNYQTNNAVQFVVINEDGTLRVMEGATTLYTVASTEEGPWKMRFLSTYENFPDVAANVSFENGFFDTIHGSITEYDFDYEFGRSPSATTDPYTGGVTIPADTGWQVVVQITDYDSIPAGAKVTLQSKTSGSTWGKIVEQTLTAGEEGNDIVIAGKTFSSDTVVRAIYSSTGGSFTPGNMIIETVEFPTPESISLKLSSTSGNARTMTASAALFQSGHVGANWQLAHRRDLSYVEIVGKVGKFPASKLTSSGLRVIGKWDLFSYGIWRGKVFLERRAAGDSWEVIRTWSGNKDRNIIAYGEVDADATLRIRVDSGMTGEAASGADVPRFLLEAAETSVYGLVKITAVVSSTVATVDIIKPAHSRETTTIWSEGAWSDVRGYPTAIALHEGRLWFGGCSSAPSMIWASTSNDFENFRKSSSDDASFAIALAAEAANFIRWLSPAASALLVGTGGEEWSIRSNVEGQPLTPTNIKAERRGAYSSANIPARLVQDSTLFVQRDGRRLRQTILNATSGDFGASDLTSLAPHVAASGIKQVAVTQTPQVIIWCVTNDGRLVSMTYEKEQNVFAWALHETTGTVYSVASLMGTASDELWLSVIRGSKAFIERITCKTAEEIQAGWQTLPHVDHARTRSGAASTSCAVPTALNGATFAAIADGIVRTGLVASAGAITLPVAASVVTWGLPYTAKLVPMDRDVPMQDGTSQGRGKRISRIGVNMVDSGGVQVASVETGVFETLPASQVGLRSGIFETAVTSSTEDFIKPCVKDSSPLPLQVQGLVVKMDVYGA
jgi:hypothetical protein